VSERHESGLENQQDELEDVIVMMSEGESERWCFSEVPEKSFTNKKSRDC